MRRLRTAPRHERRVADIALDLFDVTRPLHRLAIADRRLLRLGALVHDVGRCVSKADHPAEGAWMILGDNAMPIVDPAERRALAYLTLYHRDAVPAPGTDAVLHREDEAERMLRVLALLRVADALDSRTLDEPAQIAFTMTPTSARSAARRTVRATCYVESDCTKGRRVYARHRKCELLEDVLDVELQIEVAKAGESLRLVA